MNKNLMQKKVLEKSMGLSLPHLFLSFQDEFGYINDNPEIKEMFLSFMEQLISEGKLKLARKGIFMTGSPKEQVNAFREVWPSEYDENIPEKDIDYLWWWTLAPAGAVWFWEDGYVEWT